jgi:hypothetical protein
VALLRARVADQQSGFSSQSNLATLLVGRTKISYGRRRAPQPRGKAIYQRRNVSIFRQYPPPLPREKVYELWLFPADGGAPPAAGLSPDALGNATVNPPLSEGVAAEFLP